jgi:hypothetical protein
VQDDRRGAQSRRIRPAEPSRTVIGWISRMNAVSHWTCDLVGAPVGRTGSDNPRRRLPRTAQFPVL